MLDNSQRYQNGDRVEDNKGRAFAISPSIKCTSASGWFMTAKWQKDCTVCNRPEGEAYWVKRPSPFSGILATPSV
jgi:hypothetical protein